VLTYPFSFALHASVPVTAVLANALTTARQANVPLFTVRTDARPLALLAAVPTCISASCIQRVDTSLPVPAMRAHAAAEAHLAPSSDITVLAYVLPPALSAVVLLPAVRARSAPFALRAIILGPSVQCGGSRLLRKNGWNTLEQLHRIDRIVGCGHRCLRVAKNYWPGIRDSKLQAVAASALLLTQRTPVHDPAVLANALTNAMFALVAPSPVAARNGILAQSARASRHVSAMRAQGHSAARQAPLLHITVLASFLAPALPAVFHALFVHAEQLPPALGALEAKIVVLAFGQSAAVLAPVPVTLMFAEPSGAQAAVTAQHAVTARFLGGIGCLRQ
jgi:hypothetical protein